MGEPAFIALSQALPHLLASCWLALVRHPERVRAPSRLSRICRNAIEELLRYSGIGGRVFRRATGDADLGTVRIPPAISSCPDARLGEPRPRPVSRPRPARSRPPRRRSSLAGHRPQFLRRRTLIRIAAHCCYRPPSPPVCRSTLSSVGGWHTGDEFLLSPLRCM